MLKRVARGTILLVLACLPGACHPVNDSWAKYQEIDEAKSNLVFHGPGLDGGYRQFLTTENQRFSRITFGSYGSRHGGFPQAQIQLHELASQGNFTEALALPGYIAGGELFKGRKIIPGKAGKTSNAVGSVRYLTFMANDNPCIAFQQFMDSRAGHGLGNKRLVGYYCKRAGRPLTIGEALEIVRAIGHREHGAPEPPPEWGEE